MRKMKKVLLGLGFALSLVGTAFAQQAVVTQPISRISTNASGTIGSTGVFQSLWTQNSVRAGCLIQNNGANVMDVFFGPIASATAAKSVVLAPGQSLNCSTSGVSATDQVSITGTTADSFTAIQDGAPAINAVGASGGTGVGTNVNIAAVGGNAVTTSVPAGGIFNSTLPSPVSGTVSPLQQNSSGILAVFPGLKLISGSDGVTNTLIGAPFAGQDTTYNTSLLPQEAPFLFNGTSWDRHRSDTLGSAMVGGAVASGTSDAGNPVKTGCVFNTNLPAVTTGQRVDCQAGSTGRIFVGVGASESGADAISNALGFGFSTAGDPNTTGRPLNVYQYTFNGTSWDRQRPGPYQLSQTPVTGIGTGTTGAVVGTLAGAVGSTTYICGFDVSAVGGTAAIGPIVVAGLKGGSFTYQLFSSATGVTLSKEFTPCIPASATNTAITVTTTADGTASAVDVNAHGFQGP